MELMWDNCKVLWKMAASVQGSHYLLQCVQEAVPVHKQLVLHPFREQLQEALLVFMLWDDNSVKIQPAMTHICQDLPGNPLYQA